MDDIVVTLSKALESVCSHPFAVSVTEESDRIRLEGFILRSEYPRVLHALRRALPEGVSLDDRLYVLEDRRSIAFQAKEDQLGFARSGQESRLSPLPRMGFGILGLGAIAYAIRRRGLSRALLLAFGAGAVIRSTTNLETTRLIGSLLRPTVLLKRSIVVDAPVDFVFDWWTRFANFRRFMSFVTKVEVGDDGLLSWEVAAPAGMKVSWKARVKSLVDDQRLEWASQPGAPIQNSGKIRFAPEGTERARVDVELSFTPPAGAIGYRLSRAMGFDPRVRIDGDLLIMRALVESEARPASSLAS